MRASDLPQIYRNVNRWREIVTVLSKYGLADLIGRFDLKFAKGIFKSKQGDAIARLSQEERLRMALTELGPTFIKLGQMLSTRADVVGTKLAAELKKGFAGTDGSQVSDADIDEMFKSVGIGGEGMPESMAEINEILNVLPKKLADRVLIKYYNEIG